MILAGAFQLEIFNDSMITSLFCHCAFFDPFYMVLEYLFCCSVAHILRRDHNSRGVPA